MVLTRLAAASAVRLVTGTTEPKIAIQLNEKFNGA